MLVDKYLEWWPVHEAERILDEEAVRKQRYVSCGAYALGACQGVSGMPLLVVAPIRSQETFEEA